MSQNKGRYLKYIYALATEDFSSEQDFYDGSPTISYFYVGWTGDMKKRISSHKSDAKTGSDYPYHQKIRDLGENWEMELLEKIEDSSEKSLAEEYHMVKLTCEGHNLLNIKRGDIKQSLLDAVPADLKKLKITTGSEYAKFQIKQRRNGRIAERERKQIDSNLKHIKISECETKRHWVLGGKELILERYISRKDIVDLYVPSNSKELDRLIKMVNNLTKVT